MRIQPVGAEEHFDGTKHTHIDPFDDRLAGYRVLVDAPVVQLVLETIDQFYGYQDTMFTALRSEHPNRIHIVDAISGTAEVKTRTAVYLIERELQTVARALLQFFPRGTPQRMLFVFDPESGKRSGINGCRIQIFIPKGPELKADNSQPYGRLIAFELSVDPDPRKASDWEMRFFGERFATTDWTLLACYYPLTGYILPELSWPSDG